MFDISAILYKIAKFVYAQTLVIVRKSVQGDSPAVGTVDPVPIPHTTRKFQYTQNTIQAQSAENVPAYNNYRKVSLQADVLGVSLISMHDCAYSSTSMYVIMT